MYYNASGLRFYFTIQHAHEFDAIPMADTHFRTLSYTIQLMHHRFMQWCMVGSTLGHSLDHFSENLYRISIGSLYCGTTFYIGIAQLLRAPLQQLIRLENISM